MKEITVNPQYKRCSLNEISNASTDDDSVQSEELNFSLSPIDAKVRNLFCLFETETDYRIYWIYYFSVLSYIFISTYCAWWL